VQIILLLKVVNNMSNVFNYEIVLIVSVITSVPGTSAGFKLVVTNATYARSCAHTRHFPQHVSVHASLPLPLFTSTETHFLLLLLPFVLDPLVCFLSELMWKYGTYRQLVQLLGRVISPVATSLNTQENTHGRNADIHASSGIRTHDPSIRACQDILCFRPRGGHAIAQAVSRRLPTAAVRVRTRSDHVDKLALWHVFSEYFGFPCQLAFHRLLHNHHHLSSGAGTVDQTVAAEPSTHDKKK
jgi:hypothetical protein